jgi:hypothetical protein
MAELFASGRIVDLILLFVLLEAALLAGLGRRLGRPCLADVAAALLPGVALMLALRAALVDANWPVTAACLALALAAHLADLWRRWGRAP